MKLENQLGQFLNYPTPFYVYDLQLLEDTLNSCKKSAKKYNFQVHYALKANADEEVLNKIVAKGFGADCVSGNEISKALDLGFSTNKIVFAGVGKSDKEINTALDAEIFCFNVESLQEIKVVNDLAILRNKKAKIALRINPNVNANTHHYITTGLEENKFGINFWELESVLELLKNMTAIELIGLHFHVGSQITDLGVFKSLCLKVNEFLDWFEERNFVLEIINLGGGLGIDYYHPHEKSIVDFESYFSIFNEFIKRKNNQEIHFELGRSLVGPCGALVSRVLFIKEGIKTNFAILDAGMTELLRPALYQAYHKIANISKNNEPANHKYDVVGPICESSDCFGKAVELPLTERGDLIVLYSAGAYGEVMSSSYNLRDKAGVYYV